MHSANRFLYFLCIFLAIGLYFLLYLSTVYNFSSPFALFSPQSLHTSKMLPPLAGYYVKEEQSEDLIYILAWTKKFSRSWPEKLLHKCDLHPSAKCKLTNDRRFLNRSSALLFHPRDMNYNDLPPQKYRNQKYVFYSLESPLLTRAPLQGAIRYFFDWTMTYRNDSTIFCPYAYFEPLNSTSAYENFKLPRFAQEVRLEDNFEKRPKLIAWYVSNCETHSRRERYVYELKKYLPIDIYGDCGTYKCPKSDYRQCLEMLSRTYKFYIGFENAVCNNYISEKFTHRLALNLVIIVFRRADYEHLLPRANISKGDFENTQFSNFTTSAAGDYSANWAHLLSEPHPFFIAADDFKNPKDLADYIIYVDQHPEVYLKYFEWRKHWRVVERGGKFCFCDLCSKLHEERENERKLANNELNHMYSMFAAGIDIFSWWNAKSQCVKHYALKLT